MKLVLFCGIVIITIFILKVDAEPIDRSPSNAGRDSPPITRTASNGADGNRGPARKYVRVPMENPQISPELIEIDKRLGMTGTVKPLTPKQAAWIKRFVKCTENWLYLINNVLKLEKFQKMYEEHERKHFDMFILGRKDVPFEMIYENVNNRNDPLLLYKLIIYRISIGDIGLVQDLNIESFEIGFIKSSEKMENIRGQQSYRKDRTYSMKAEATFPELDVKFKYEIVQGNRKGDFDPLINEDDQVVKPGYLRIKMLNVKLRIKIFLTEIDKSFVHIDTETGDKYYFRKPEILDFKFGMEDAEYFPFEFQEKPASQDGVVVANISQQIEAKILRDFTEFLVESKYEEERNKRLKATLINRYSRAIMVSSQVILIPVNLDVETAFDNPELPYIDPKPNEMELDYKVFYMSYSLPTFVNTCIDYFFKIMKYQSAIDAKREEEKDEKLTDEERQKKREERKKMQKELQSVGDEAFDWMQEQAANAKARTKLTVTDDGFDWSEGRSRPQPQLKPQPQTEEDSQQKKPIS